MIAAGRRTNRVSLASAVVALGAAGFVYTVTIGGSPLGLSGHSAFAILWAIGLGMSILAGTRDSVPTASGQPDFSALGWTMGPLMALGFAAMAMLPAVLLGASFPPIGGVPGEFAALATIIAIKWVLAHLHFLA
jgi:hypothetical protein